MASKVYFTKDISQEGLLKIYEVLGAKLKGKVAVKISSGEPGGKHFLNPQLIKPLVNKLNGTIVECNTAYKGRRHNSKDHWEAIREHGFLDIAPCDILDEDGEKALPVKGGIQLRENFVGDHIDKYDSMLVLSHFKGHVAGGFGGAIKNIAIGVASSRGKTLVHTAGTTDDLKLAWSGDQNAFLESMADAFKSVVEYMGKENFAYVSVANNLSVDCDCDSHPAPPQMADIGIFASLDPGALDWACVDAVYASKDEGKAALIERMESRNAFLTLEAAQKHGLGQKEYELVNIDL